MSGLSSRVMNMKFMQKNGEEHKEEEIVKRVKDSSEWTLPAQSKVSFRTRPIKVVESIGYASINAYQEGPNSSVTPSLPSGRRTWGAPTPDAEQDEDKEKLSISKLKDSVDKKKTNKKPHQPEDQSSEFLRNLWDKKNPNTKPAENTENSTSNKREGEYIPNIRNKQKRIN